MLFLSLVVVPLVKTDPDSQSAQRGFIKLARRFRTMAWGALAILVVTGSLLLGTFVDLSDPIPSWPSAVKVKLTLVVMFVAVSLAHDRIIAPKVRALKQKSSSKLSYGENVLLNFSPFIGRLTLLLGMGVFLSAVFMVRT